MKKTEHLKYRLALTVIICLAFMSVSFGQSKGEIINGSYFIAFGRFPDSREFREWEQGGSYTIDQMVNFHRGHISRNTQERTATITRAYMDAFGWDPSANDISYWSSRNSTYAEVFNAQMSNLKSNTKSKTLVIQQSYYRAFNQLPSAAQLQYWMNQPTYSFAQLVAFHTTWKNQGRNSTAVTGIQNKLNQNGISTFSLSAQGAAAVIAAGGANVIAAGGGNVIAAGGANVIAAGGAN
ncbi:hypothetical protein DVR12_20885 [Chitinophaga silvatica]|uniref:DUF4214 domain-containing protein n=1 Tax=Chitinophaga silvatica TaxID=2282649 RepID=A0A3E1Y612_9BACT|nr:hypothetical protein [Chitinophaga silvatica]RFS20173.1 hypothetical protein DVR12_20885 [Chitinophaga silvatica]